MRLKDVLVSEKKLNFQAEWRYVNLICLPKYLISLFVCHSTLYDLFTREKIIKLAQWLNQSINQWLSSS